MLIDRYESEDVFARVPELAAQTDPVLAELDRLLEDDQLYVQVRRDLAQRYRLTPVHGRHSTPAEVNLRLLVVQHHRAVLGRSPWLVTGDRRLHARGLEAAAQGLGVQQGVIPWTGTLSAAWRAHEQERRWRRRYRWRPGIEGRISSLRREYGLERSRSHGMVGLERDVGWGVLASDLRHLASAQAHRSPVAVKRAA